MSFRSPHSTGPAIPVSDPTGCFSQRLAELLQHWLDFGWKCFSCSSTLFTDCTGNISVTYYTSFYISRFCPLLYIAARTPGINHFLASLLHEMKEFIMVTVAIARRSLVIYMDEIDWFIKSEWTVLCFGGSAAYLAETRCMWWEITCSDLLQQYAQAQVESAQLISCPAPGHWLSWDPALCGKEQSVPNWFIHMPSNKMGSALIRQDVVM